MIAIRKTVAAAAVAVLGLAGAVWAQPAKQDGASAYPSRPIRLVVPVPPGGSSDGLGCEQALDLYRRGYRPSERYPNPQATICVWALAADTEEEARRLALTREHARVLRDIGVREALVTPEEAAAYPYNAAQLAKIESMRRRAFVGTGEQVREKLTALAQSLALDELVVVTWTHDPAARHRSYEILAEAFELMKAA